MAGNALTHGGTVLQLSGPVGDAVDWIVGGVVDVVPVVLQAVVVLLVGIVLGTVLRSTVYELAVKMGLDERVDESPFGTLFGDGRDAVASGLANAVKYLIFAVAILIAIGLLNVRVLSQLNQTLLLYAPRVLAAILVGIVGFAVGRIAYRLVAEALDGRGLSDRVSGTLLGGVVDAEGDVLADTTARIVEYYVYLVALFVAADVLQLSPLEAVLSGAVFYAPQLLAAGAVVVLGVLVAKALGHVAAGSEAAARTPAPEIVGEATKAVVVVVAGAVALSVAGVDSTLLIAVLAVVILPLGIGLALALGLSLGYGGREFVRENIDDWT